MKRYELVFDFDNQQNIHEQFDGNLDEAIDYAKQLKKDVCMCIGVYENGACVHVER